MSTARLPSGEYETMLLGQDGDEIVSAKSAGEEEALATFRYFKMVYSAPVLTGRYKKLSEDLKAAFAYGREHQGTDDGGTSNFDAPTIHLRGWSRKMVEAAAAARWRELFILEPLRQLYLPCPWDGARKYSDGRSRGRPVIT